MQSKGRTLPAAHSPLRRRAAPGTSGSALEPRASSENPACSPGQEKGLRLQALDVSHGDQ